MWKFFYQWVTDITGTHSTIPRKLHDEDNHQIKTNEVIRACGMYEGEERCIQGFGERETIWKT
jgi:hypothetical protein